VDKAANTDMPHIMKAMQMKQITPEQTTAKKIFPYLATGLNPENFKRMVFSKSSNDQGDEESWMDPEYDYFSTLEYCKIMHNQILSTGIEIDGVIYRKEEELEEIYMHMMTNEEDSYYKSYSPVGLELKYRQNVKNITRDAQLPDYVETKINLEKEFISNRKSSDKENLIKDSSLGYKYLKSNSRRREPMMPLQEEPNRDSEWQYLDELVNAAEDSQ
jgi:hypothetical protein